MLLVCVLSRVCNSAVRHLHASRLHVPPPSIPPQAVESPFRPPSLVSGLSSRLHASRFSTNASRMLSKSPPNLHRIPPNASHASRLHVPPPSIPPQAVGSPFRPPSLVSGLSSRLHASRFSTNASRMLSKSPQNLHGIPPGASHVSRLHASRLP